MKMNLNESSLRAPDLILRRHTKENETEELSLRRSRRAWPQGPTVAISYLSY